MKKNDFSIILTTMRGIESLKPLFEITDEDTELIISDSDYNEKTKKWLKKQKGYRQIVYIPITEYKTRYTKDNVLGYNIAFQFAESDWIIRADDNLEFKPDFFEVAREDIRYFRDLFDNKFAIIGSKLWGQLNQKKWESKLTSSTSRYNEISDSRFSFSFGVIPIEMIYSLNGYQELYDNAWGYDDIDFLDRGFVAGFKFWFDKELMAYSYPHKPAIPSFSINQMIYELQKLEIYNGKTYAYNQFDIRQSQSLALAIKDKYIIEC